MEVSQFISQEVGQLQAVYSSLTQVVVHWVWLNVKTQSLIYLDKGIGVGNTLKEIKESYPKSEIHGCDIEGKTIVMAGDYHFLLEDTFFYSYIIDESKIAPSTKIKMITIRN